MREEQSDESEEFIKLFGPTLAYIQGARTASGFYTVEEIEYATRMYRIHEPTMPNQGGSIHLEPVPLSDDSLDPRHVFLGKCSMSSLNKEPSFLKNVNKQLKKQHTFFLKL